MNAQKAWHALTADETLTALTVPAATGLADNDVSARRATHGFNELPEAVTRSWVSVFLHQFQSPLVYLLLGASVIAVLLGHQNDAGVIFVVVLLNAIIGAVQEGKAENALAALRQGEKPKARVLREGQRLQVDARELVPGDLVFLEAGDAVSADARLLESHSLQVAEAALTGESLPVDKATSPLASDTLLADRRNMLYSGTHVTAGRARAVVVATGLSTEIGRIAHLAETAEQPRTPLERRIETFGRWLLWAAALLFGLIALLGWLRGMPWADIFMLGISQVVSMVPEGLPVAVTIALAVGVQRMAQRRAVVRRLSAIETLGSTTVICSDKTGTLTRNEMTVTHGVLADGRAFSVSGVGYSPVGQLLWEGEAPSGGDALWHEFLKALVLCNDAHLGAPREAGSDWVPLGDPTEVALLTFAQKAGASPEALRRQFPRQAELPFDSTTKVMATQHEVEGAVRVFLKGAPEVMGELAAPGDAESLRGVVSSLTQKGLRVLAIGVTEGFIDGRAGVKAFSGKVRLLGLLGQMDPPRSEVKASVALCQSAGIRPVMVTGDHPATGLTIARSLGMAKEGDLSTDGRQLEAMSDAQLAASVERISVFARVHPEQKLRIVSALQVKGQVVAMTGDGVNDAPALVKANVGVAMGRSGTEVAKEAAKVILTDDNFATLVAAIEEGRVVYRNIQKLLLYLFSTNLAEVCVLLGGLVLGLPPPLAAVQILWINLVTDGALTVPLVMEPKEGDEMARPPISPQEPLLTRTLLTRMAFMVPTITISTLGWYAYRLSNGVPFIQIQTETFTVLALSQLFNALNCRSEDQSAFRQGVFQNPWMVGGLVIGLALHGAVIFLPPLARIFYTQPFDTGVALELVAVSSGVFWVEEARKAGARIWGRKRLNGL